MLPLALCVKDLFRFFTERNKKNDGKLADSSIIYEKIFGLLLPSYDVTVLLITSFLEGSENY